jgi:hypothetical protein
MSGTEQLRQLERGFWLEGADYYREHVAAEFVLLFPGMGAMDRAQAIEGIEGGRRWEHLETEGEKVVHLGADVRLLYYRARARRAGAAEYSAWVASVYVRRGGAWKLAFHQQSPEGGDRERGRG